jgi:hypothetical protein
MGDVGTYLVKGMYRNRGLLDLAHRIETCQNCGDYRGEGMDPGHSNLSEHGKAKGLKSHDCFWAALCGACHRWLDNQGSGRDPSGIWSATAAEKREMFIRAMHKTWLLIFRNGWVRVA